MRAFINDTEYRLLDDYQLEEIAGSTAIMTANVNIEDKDEPKPFDNVKFYSDNIDITKDVINKAGTKTNVKVENQTLILQEVQNATIGDVAETAWKELTFYAKYISSFVLTYAGIMGSKSGIYTKYSEITNNIWGDFITTSSDFNTILGFLEGEKTMKQLTIYTWGDFA